MNRSTRYGCLSKREALRIRDSSSNPTSQQSSHGQKVFTGTRHHLGNRVRSVDERVVNFDRVRVGSSKQVSVTILQTFGTRIQTFTVTGSFCRDVSCPDLLLPLTLTNGCSTVITFTWQPQETYELLHQIPLQSPDGSSLILTLKGKSESYSPRLWSQEFQRKQQECDVRNQTNAAASIQKCWKRHKIRESVFNKWCKIVARLKLMQEEAVLIQKWWRKVMRKRVDHLSLCERSLGEVVQYEKFSISSFLFSPSDQLLLIMKQTESFCSGMFSSKELEVLSCIDVSSIEKMAQKVDLDLTSQMTCLRNELELIRSWKDDSLKRILPSDIMSYDFLSDTVVITDSIDSVIVEIRDTKNNGDQKQQPTFDTSSNRDQGQPTFDTSSNRDQGQPIFDTSSNRDESELCESEKSKSSDSKSSSDSQSCDPKQSKSSKSSLCQSNSFINSSLSNVVKFTRQSLQNHPKQMLIAIPVIVLAAYTVKRICNKSQ